MKDTLEDSARMTTERVLEILEETKKAVQTGIGNQSLNSRFVHCVSINDEVYFVQVEKYVPASQLIEKYIHLLTDE